MAAFEDVIMPILFLIYRLVYIMSEKRAPVSKPLHVLSVQNLKIFTKYDGNQIYFCMKII